MLATLAIGAAFVAVIVSQTSWFRDWLRGVAARQAEKYVDGQVSIGRIDGNLFSGAELSDVSIAMNGVRVIAVRAIGVDYDLFTLLGGRIVLDRIRVDQPHVRLARTAEGWNLARMIKARPTNPDEPRTTPTITIGDLSVSDGTLDLDGVTVTGLDVPSRVEHIDLSASVQSDRQHLQASIAHLSLQTVDPALRLIDLSGVFRRASGTMTIEDLAIRTAESSLRADGSVTSRDAATPRLTMSVSSDRLTLAEIAPLVPALDGFVLQPAFTLSARGPADALAVAVDARDASAGQIGATATVDVTTRGPRATGEVQMDHLNIGPLARQADLASDITGRATFDLTLPVGNARPTVTFDATLSRATVDEYRARDVVLTGTLRGNMVSFAGRASAFGGSATATGVVTVASPLALDLGGRADGVDLRNLPRSLGAPAVDSDLHFEYAIRRHAPVFSGSVRTHASTLAGASIAAGTTAQFTVSRGAYRYQAEGSAADVDLQRVGRTFDLPALAADRYRSRIDALFTVAGSGGGRAPLAVQATATLTDADVFGASFHDLDVSADLSGGDARVSVTGPFAGLDPARVTGTDRARAALDGTLAVRATLHDYAEGVTLDSVDAAGRITLGRSHIGDLTIGDAVLDGQYANRRGTITQLHVSGPDLMLQAQGPLSLDTGGTSNVTFHVESPSLDRIGALIGQPLAGAATVDGGISGNATELLVWGTLDGSDVGYGSTSAIGLTTNFDVSIPALDMSRATAHAKSFATLATVAGQGVNQIDADTTWANGMLYYSVDAHQPTRQLTAGGTILFRPDHQEIHLPTFILRSGTLEWRTPEGADAVIDHSGDRIEIEGFELRSGAQQIAAAGTIGGPGETLRVTMQQVDVGSLTRLALDRNGPVDGQLDATATISGSTVDPRVDARFSLVRGAFDSFAFESLAGTAQYTPRGVDLDVRLQQTPTAWITAAGFAPMTLFEDGLGASGRRHQAGSAADMVDIRVESSAIDLGIVQGFTDVVSGVGGTLQANFTVTGSGRDPHLLGGIDVRNGRFDVPALGTAYTGLDTHVALTGDTVDIGRLRILDSGGHVLAIDGHLAVHQEAIDAIDLKLEASDFQAIDNDFGDLHIDTDLRVSGTLGRPRIDGKLNVSTGTVDVAQVLSRATAEAYANEVAGPSTGTEESAAEQVRRNGDIPAEAFQLPQASLNPEPLVAAAPEKEPAATSGAFDRLALDLSVHVPDDLELKGDDLRTGTSSVSLGDVNVTVGGDVRVRKQAGEPVRLVGEITTVRGSYTFQGRRFDIARDGRIRFVGTDPIDPLIDIEASRVISGIQTFVQVKGTMRQPEISFRSTPPLDEADILSLIIFNQPINQLGEGQQASLAQRAAGLASGYLASGLARSIGNALDLNEFQIQTTGENGAGPSVTIGEQFGQNLFVRLQQGFGNSSITQFILEYQITQLLRLRGTIAQIPAGADRILFRRVERGGLDLIFFFAY